MLQLRMELGLVFRLQLFNLIQGCRNRRSIRILYPNMKLDKCLFDFRLWHFGEYYLSSVNELFSRI
jgi:hypothetical protein